MLSVVALARRHTALDLRRLGAASGRVAAAAAAAAVAGRLALVRLPGDEAGTVGRLGSALAAVGVAGVAVTVAYVATLLVLRSPELRELWTLLAARVSRPL